MKAVRRAVAVRRITETLKGPVADVFRQSIPSLEKVSGGELYDAVMGDGDLLKACMVVFQKRREAFAHLLVDERNRPVHDDFVPLRCGRSVHDIVAMVVRSHAKRQFSKSLGGTPGDPTSRANQLYRAINEYLIHDWQVAMVPHYAPLPVERVKELGPILLDAHDPEALERITGVKSSPVPLQAPPVAAEPVAPPPPVAMSAVPPPPPPAATAAGRSKDEEYWWETLNDPMVRRALSLDENSMREIIAALVTIGDGTRREVMSGLGLTMAQAAVVLTTAFRVMGRNGFTAIFGTPGKVSAVKLFADRLAATDQRKRNDMKGLALVVASLLQPSGGGRALAG